MENKVLLQWFITIGDTTSPREFLNTTIIYNIMKSVKVLYIEARQKRFDFEIPEKELEKLPRKIILAYSIQYKELANHMKKLLEKKKIKISKFIQVLGCSRISNKENLPVLLVSTGKFHSENLYFQAPIIHVLEENKITKVSDESIKKIKAHKRAALINFLSAEKIGILISIKQGQENMKKAIELKKKIEKKYKNKKQAFLFVSDNIDVSQFENFDIDSWVNTACKGISVDKTSVINRDELPKL